MANQDIRFFATAAPPDVASGFRAGNIGTHSSRTMMLSDLTAVLNATKGTAARTAYAQAIIDGNCLGKPTASTRRLSNQRLGELYALDPVMPVFRVFRHLWDVDPEGRPLLALLLVLARDPLLMATVPSVIRLPNGAELQRDAMKEALRHLVGSRMNDSILDKVVRNSASTWCQSGHFEGRTFKKRRLVRATPGAIAFALYLGYLAGFRGNDLLTTGWVSVLDCSPSAAHQLALTAKRIGLIDLRTAGEVLDLGLERLDPLKRRA